MKLNNKNKILIFASVVFVIIAYKTTISKTFHYYTSYKNISELLKNSEKEKKSLGFLYAKNKKLNAILNKNDFPKNSINYQNYLLKTISSLSEKNNLKILNFEEPEILSTEKEKIIHYKFSVEGNFNNALIFLNQLENKPLIGKLLHFSTEKKMDYKGNKVRIISSIVIEKKLTNNKV